MKEEHQGQPSSPFLSDLDYLQQVGRWCKTGRSGRQHQRAVLRYPNRLIEWADKNRSRLFSVVPSAGTRDHGHQLKHVKFSLNIRKHFSALWVMEHGHRLLIEVVESPKASWTWSWATFSGWPCFSKVWTRCLQRFLPITAILWLWKTPISHIWELVNSIVQELFERIKDFNGYSLWNRDLDTFLLSLCYWYKNAPSCFDSYSFVK